MLGSPSYLSPEAASAQPVDWRADQFSLATVIIEIAKLEAAAAVAVGEV